MGIEFFQTVMGRAFYEGTMPNLVRELSRLNKNLEKGLHYAAPLELSLPVPSPLKPTGHPPGWRTDLVRTVARDAEKSGEAAGRLVGSHILELLEDHSNGHETDETKHINHLITELKVVEEWAASIRKKLEQEL